MHIYIKKIEFTDSQILEPVNRVFRSGPVDLNKLTPIDKCHGAGEEDVQSCPRRWASLVDERPTRWSTRGAPEISFYAASFNGGKLESQTCSGVSSPRLE